MLKRILKIGIMCIALCCFFPRQVFADAPRLVWIFNATSQISSISDYSILVLLKDAGNVFASGDAVYYSDDKALVYMNRQPLSNSNSSIKAVFSETVSLTDLNNNIIREDLNISASELYATVYDYARLNVWTKTTLYTLTGDLINNVMEYKRYFHLIRDNIAPEITINGGNVSSRGSSVSLSATAIDDLSGVDQSTWQYSYNGGPKKNGSSVSFSEEGTYTVTFYVQDNVKNLGSRTTTVVTDRTAPSAVISGDMGSTWSNAASRTISVSASDAVSGIGSIESSTDNGKTWRWTSSLDSLSLTYSEQGTFYPQFRVKDKAGNERVLSGQVNLDRNPPIIEGFAPPGGGWLKPGFQFSGIKVKDSIEAAAANSGVNALSMRISPAGKTAISVNPGYNSSSGVVSPFTVDLPEGKYAVVFSVEDNAGNRGQASATVQIDGAAPVFSASLGGPVRRDGAGWMIPLLLSGVQDVHSGINPGAWKYRIDNGAETGFSVSGSGSSLAANIRVGTLTGNSHAIKISGTDNAGNTKTVELALVLDTTVPVIRYDDLLGKTPEGATWTNRGSVSIGAADTESGIESFTGEIKRRQSDGTWSISTDAVFDAQQISFTPGTADGVFQILLKARDRAGNLKEETLYTRIDRTAPVLTVPGGINTAAEVTANGSDPMSGIAETSWEWRIDNGPWNQGKTAVIAEGKLRNIGFRVKDKAGNQAEKNGTITIDTSPPVVRAVVPAYAEKESLAVDGLNASDTYTGISGIWYQIDGGTKQSIGGTGTKTLAIPIGNHREGRHRLVFSAEDGAGHTGTSEEYPFVIDRTSPLITTVEIRDSQNPDRILDDDDYITEHKIIINMEGDDWYRDGDSPWRGEIRYWYWTIGQRETAAPEFTGTGRSSQGAFTIEGFVQGVNYLYLCAEDGAGNRSPVIRRIVSRDPSIPGMPIIDRKSVV
jgi:hypothetical protein